MRLNTLMLGFLNYIATREVHSASLAPYQTRSFILMLHLVSHFS